jgi:hypothetical protein
MKHIAVAVTLACLIVAIGTPSAPAQRIGLITVFAVTKRQVDDGRFHMVVKNVRDKKSRTIGEVDQFCVDVPDAGADNIRQQCQGTLIMPLGRLMYMGARRSATYYVFAVVGGTGVYSGSTGQYQARTISTDPRVEYLLVSLVP